jgi:hypothetical protein
VLILVTTHLQALKESAISKQLTICPKIKIWIQILLENIKHFSKVIVHSQDQKVI